jgi:hypothetical protein
MRRQPPPPTEAADWTRPSERFLAYLDRLSEACLARDRDQLEKLMRMRMSSHLPRAILDEMEYFKRAKSENLRAPLKLMRHVHKMRQLATVADDAEGQLPLELREREVSAPVSETRRRAKTESGKRERE